MGVKCGVHHGLLNLCLGVQVRDLSLPTSAFNMHWEKATSMLFDPCIYLLLGQYALVTPCTHPPHPQNPCLGRAWLVGTVISFNALHSVTSQLLFLLLHS